MQPSVERPPRVPVRLQTSGRRFIAGLAMIVLGILALVATLTTSAVIGETVVFALGIAFIAWGVLVRGPGLMIPGGILTGIGAGVLLSQSVFTSLSGEAAGGIVTLCMGLGFLAIMPLQAIFTDTRAHWWPAIPGGILSVVGISLLLGEAGQNLLLWLGRLWPVVLIAAGLLVIYRVARRQSSAPPLAHPPEPMTPPEPASPEPVATPLTLPRDIAPDALPPSSDDLPPIPAMPTPAELATPLTPAPPEPPRVPVAR